MDDWSLVGEKINVENLIRLLNHRIETGYTTKNGSCYSDYRLEVKQNYDEDGKYKGSTVRLIKKGCKECGGALVDEDDLLCHKCYHQSVPEGECWCENLPPKCECESDDEYSITESGCDNLNCSL